MTIHPLLERDSDLPSQLALMTGDRSTLVVLIVGCFSGILYLCNYWLQRAIYLNGLTINFSGLEHLTNPQNHQALYLQLSGYLAANLLLLGLYLFLIHYCRPPRNLQARTRALLLGFPLLFNICLLWGQPFFSIDVFSYMAHGYFGSLPGGNPYFQPAKEAIGTPIGLDLLRFGWRPVHDIPPYGPLWENLEILIMRITRSVPVAMILFKSLLIGASLGTATILWKILGHVRPDYQLLGTVFYLWNPVILIEIAAEGHNDALMVLFVSGSILASVRSRVVTSMVSLFLGVLTKYLPLIFVPVQGIYLWRTQQQSTSIWLRIVRGSLLSLLAGLILYQPVWIGLDTFQGMQIQSGPTTSAMPLTLLFWYLRQHFPTDQALTLTSIVLRALCLTLILSVSWRATSPHKLFKACALTALIYLVLGSPVYWPWYICLPLSLMALLPNSHFVRLALALSLGERLAAPLAIISGHGFLAAIPAEIAKSVLGLIVPLLLYLGLGLGINPKQTSTENEPV